MRPVLPAVILPIKLNVMRTTAYLLAVLMVFSSCTAPLYMYTPPAINNPHLTEKGDADVKAAFSLGGGGGSANTNEEQRTVNGGDVQAAMAITNKWAVQTSVSATKESNGIIADDIASSQRNNRYKRWHAEAGWGYFTPINRRGSLYFSLFAGGGLGAYKASLATRSNPNYGFFNNRVNRVYLQPSLYGNWGAFRFGISTKLTSQGYTGISTSLTAQQQEQEGVDGIGGGRALFWENSTRLGVCIKGLPWLSPELQTTFSGELTGRVRHMNHGLFSLGVRIHLNNLNARR